MKTAVFLLISIIFSHTLSAYQRSANITEVNGENLRVLEKVNGRAILKVVQKLPYGTKFKFRTEATILKPFIKNSKGKIVKSRSNFLGQLTLISADGISNSRIKELNKKKIFLYAPSTALTEVRLEVSSEKGALIGNLITNVAMNPKVSKYLSIMDSRISKGTIISFRPNQFISFPYYLKKGENKLSRSGARYLGPIKIISSPILDKQAINKLNAKNLYVYEWHMNKVNMIRSLYDVEVPKGEAWINDKFLWDKQNPSGGWAHFTANFILNNGTELLNNPPSDVEDFCPAYHEIDDRKKAIFWVHLMNSIAKKESLFDPGVKNDESGFGAEGNEVISRGLMQISLESSKNRNYQRLGCLSSVASDLHNPIINLQCGVAIFNHLTNDQNCISCKYPEGHRKEGKFAGIARYWSTLRTPYEVSCRICSSGKVKLGYRDQIIEKTINTKYCKKDNK